MKEILVVIENDRQDISDLSKEMLGLGKEFAQSTGASLTAIVFGQGFDHLAEVVSAFGGDLVYLVENPAANHFNSEIYLETLEHLIKKQEPALVLLGMTVNGRDLGGRLAARLRTVFIPGCAALSLNQAGEIQVTRIKFAGCAQEWVTIQNQSTVILGVAPEIRGIGAPVLALTPKRERIDLVLPSLLKVNHLDIYVSNPDEIDLTEADLVIAGGNGMGDQQGFGLLQEAGALIGASLGGSRVAVDKGWIPPARMIGATGKVIRAKVYMAVGIAGAVQHMMGIKDCHWVIAVNKNPRAEMMLGEADLAVVGDSREILPALLKELEDYMPKTEVGLGNHETEKTI